MTMLMDGNGDGVLKMFLLSLEELLFLDVMP
jgi:hypothetical protein